MTPRLECGDVDALAAEYAVGALEPSMEREIAVHLRTCPAPHTETREWLAVAERLPDSLDAAEPSPALRNRIMRTITRLEQERAPARTEAHGRPVRGRFGWFSQRVASGVALAAVVLALAVGVRLVQLEQQTAEREQLLRAVAAAEATYAVTGPAGEGWILETEQGVLFVAADLEAPPPDHIYELWLLDRQGQPIPVGVLTDAGEGVLSTVRLDRDLGGAAAFAVTAERGRVERPTTDPVLVASLE